MSRYEQVQRSLRREPRTWLITGVAGFIGANLAEHLLALGQKVVGVDSFITGHRHNIEDIRASVGNRVSRFRFVEGDIRDLETCRSMCEGVDYVLHQAAVGSVPRSIDNPIATNQANVDGFLNMLVAARDAGVHRFVYAASSSTYGDDETLPKVEERIGRPLSPYAVSKYVNELYAGVFQRTYGFECIGLRYFNVFGRRQDPNGAYAAVIPKWIGRLLNGKACVVNGDGSTSRDFTYIDNVLQANLLAALSEQDGATDQIYNVACGERATLTELFGLLRDGLAKYRPEIAAVAPRHDPPRPGDIGHSEADISKIATMLGYRPTHRLADGLEESLAWYVNAACERAAA